MLTLWDLLPKSLRPEPPPAKPAAKPSSLKIPHSASDNAVHVAPRAVPVAPKAPAQRPVRTRRKPAAVDVHTPLVTSKSDPMQARYDRVVESMLAKYGVRVRKWRTSMSGVAWTVTYRDGKVSRLIESPRPKGPMSAAVFLHEIGHHALGIGAFKPRCLEEYHAWAFAIRAMEAEGLNVTDAVRDRMRRSLEYAVRKAMRRGLQSLPVELAPYVPTPRR